MDETLKSLFKAVGILEKFDYTRTRMTLSEVAAANDMPISTASRLLASLCEAGLLEKTDKQYFLGFKLFQLGQVAAKNFNFEDVIDPLIHELARSTNEMVSVNVLRGDQRVCIRQIESPRSIRENLPLGRALPLYAGATGRVLLAFQTDEFIERYLESTELARLTDLTIVDRDRLREELMLTRERGYCCTEGERNVGVLAISAPIFNIEGLLEAALTVGIVSITGVPDKQEVIELVKATAKRASARMGYIESPKK